MKTMKMRVILYVTLGIFLCTFIIGTFLDLKISDALFRDRNTFGLVVSVIGTTP